MGATGVQSKFWESRIFTRPMVTYRAPGLFQPVQPASSGSNCSALPVQVGSVEVYETYKPGRLIRIQTRDPNGVWDTVWTGEAQDPSTFPAARIFAPPLESRAYATQHVRLEVDFITKSEYYEIDAVAVVSR